MSRAEVDRLSGAVRFMHLCCRPRVVGLWLLTTDRGASRSVIADIWKRVTKLQRIFGFRCYSVLVFEGGGGLHAHVAFLGSSEIVDRLKRSMIFGPIIDCTRVRDPDGLARGYLAKERTPQAGWRRNHVLGGRLRGSHRLPGGGDRVRLSRDLERDAVEAGYVRAWRHTNAKRQDSARRHPCGG
jgi:hypothetical protein